MGKIGGLQAMTFPYKHQRGDQPAPKPGKTPVWKTVIDDMEARDNLGFERYGTRLETHNGRDALLDAYEEALDLAVYLKQAILEKKEKTMQNYKKGEFCKYIKCISYPNLMMGQTSNCRRCRFYQFQEYLTINTLKSLVFLLDLKSQKLIISGNYICFCLKVHCQVLIFQLEYSMQLLKLITTKINKKK